MGEREDLMKEFWEKGFPYGANYQYRTGMFS